ncbi:MAG: PAS domain S-box protein, partial [Candidatus Hydrogenedentes bacterium]|nr:PAS domain S-box protein [Candidatus Hydrogenedentota bacterium]
METRYIRKDATVVWVNVNMTVIRDAAGQPVRTMATIEDISERKRADDALRESEERYRTLFDRANDGIFLLSTDGKLVSLNDSLARMHGYSVDEMLDMSLKDLDTPETSRQIPVRMQRLLAGEALTFEVEHYHKDGHVFPLEVSASLITSGGESYIQCFHRDITERK